MRLLCLLAASAVFSSCTSTVLSEPIVHASPYLAIYKLRGATSVQSNTNQPGAPQDNAAVSMNTFGHDRSREDVGLRVDVGDGFGGLRADYYKLDMDTSRSGVLANDWGQLRAGESVNLFAEMDELRLGYVEPLLDARADWRGEELRLRLGAGGVLAVRDMDLRAKEASNTRRQSVTFRGDVAFFALRAHAAWQDVELDLDYAIAPEAFALGGDVEGVSQDLEARVSYRLPQGDMRFFAGYRLSEFAAAADADGLLAQSDLEINGLQLGFLVTF